MGRMKLFKFGFDFLFLVGAGVFAFGVWMAWHPLGVMAAGMELAAVGFLLGYGSRGKSE